MPSGCSPAAGLILCLSTERYAEGTRAAAAQVFVHVEQALWPQNKGKHGFLFRAEHFLSRKQNLKERPDPRHKKRRYHNKGPKVLSSLFAQAATVALRHHWDDFARFGACSCSICNLHLSGRLHLTRREFHLCLLYVFCSNAPAPLDPHINTSIVNSAMLGPLSVGYASKCQTSFCHACYKILHPRRKAAGQLRSHVPRERISHDQ